MTGLVNTTLQSVCTLVTDGTHDTPKVLSEGIPFIKAKQIANGIIDFANCEFISYIDHLKVISRSKPEKGDTLFAHIGATLGATAYVNTSIEFSIKNVALFKPNPNIIDPRYLYYLVMSDGFQSSIKNYRTGAAQPFVSLDILRNQPIKYHNDIKTQRKIAAILSAYDDLIENNTRRIRILEEMAQTLYRHWFVDYQFPGHEHVPLVDSGTDLGELPQGWEVRKLGDLAESVRRSVNPGKLKQKTPYFGLEHLPRKSIALNQWEMIDDIGSTKLSFHRGEILFGKIRPYFHKVGVAPLNGIGSSDIIIIRPKESGFFGLVLAVVSSERFVEFSTLTSQGTKMPRANWDVMSEYPIPFPRGDLLERYAVYMQETVELIINYIIKNTNLRTTRDLLLPKLVSGELDVSEVEVA